MTENECPVRVKMRALAVHKAGRGDEDRKRSSRDAAAQEEMCANRLLTPHSRWPTAAAASPSGWGSAARCGPPSTRSHPPRVPGTPAGCTGISAADPSRDGHRRTRRPSRRPWNSPPPISRASAWCGRSGVGARRLRTAPRATTQEQQTQSGGGSSHPAASERGNKSQNSLQAGWAVRARWSCDDAPAAARGFRRAARLVLTELEVKGV